MGLFKEKVQEAKKFKTFGVRLPIELVDKLADAKKKVKQMGLEWTFDEEVTRFVEKLIDKNAEELSIKYFEFQQGVTQKVKELKEELKNAPNTK